MVSGDRTWEGAPPLSWGRLAGPLQGGVTSLPSRAAAPPGYLRPRTAGGVSGHHRFDRASPGRGDRGPYRRGRPGRARGRGACRPRFGAARVAAGRWLQIEPDAKSSHAADLHADDPAVDGAPPRGTGRLIGSRFAAAGVVTSRPTATGASRTRAATSRSANAGRLPSADSRSSSSTAAPRCTASPSADEGVEWRPTSGSTHHRPAPWVTSRARCCARMRPA